MKKRKSLFLLAIAMILFVIILFIYPYLRIFIPFTRWEAVNSLKDGENKINIVVSLMYLEEHTSFDNVELVIDYLDCSWGGEGSFMHRGYGVKHSVIISYLANKVLEKATDLDFGYDEEFECTDEVNQQAIQSWYDWYENEYEEWVFEQ